MANKRFDTIDDVDDVAVREQEIAGLSGLVRRLEMAEERQRDTLANTRAQLSTLRRQLARVVQTS